MIILTTMQKKQDAKKAYLDTLTHLLKIPRKIINQTIYHVQEGLKHVVQGELFEEDVG